MGVFSIAASLIPVGIEIQQSERAAMDERTLGKFINEENTFMPFLSMEAVNMSQIQPRALDNVDRLDLEFN
jgi:tRNA G10  N-methylase Trm11